MASRLFPTLFGPGSEKPSTLKVSLRWGESNEVRRGDLPERRYSKDSKASKKSKDTILLEDWLDVGEVDPRKRKRRIAVLVARSLLVWCLSLLLVTFTLYQTLTIDLIISFHLIGLAVFPGSIGVLIYLVLKLTSYDKEEKKKRGLL